MRYLATLQSILIFFATVSCSESDQNNLSLAQTPPVQVVPVSIIRLWVTPTDSIDYFLHRTSITTKNSSANNRGYVSVRFSRRLFFYDLDGCSGSIGSSWVPLEHFVAIESWESYEENNVITTILNPPMTDSNVVLYHHVLDNKLTWNYIGFEGVLCSGKAELVTGSYP